LLGQNLIKYPWSKVNFENLKGLNLFGNKIGDKGEEYLSKMNLENLKELNLSYNNIKDKGANYLSKMNLEISNNFTFLEILLEMKM